MKKGRYRKIVFVVVYRKERDKILYLLLKRKLHWKGWEFPKGGVEDGEINEETIKREVREETGQRCFNIKKYFKRGKNKYDKLYPDRRGFIGHKWRLFSCEVKDKKVNLDKKEHSTYSWKEFDEAEKLLTWDNQKDCLRLVDKKIS